MLTITISPRYTRILLEYPLELHILASGTDDRDPDAVKYLEDDSHNIKAHEFGVVTHKHPVQQHVLLCEL